MKIVSLKVAKAIKEAGYPLQRFHTVSREQFEYGWGSGIYGESPSILYPEDNDFVDMYFCPTYLEVWLWLCKTGITFYPAKYSAHNPSGWSCYYCDNMRIIDIDTFGIYIDPEDAIVAAIEYLVENNLLKQ